MGQKSSKQQPWPPYPYPPNPYGPPPQAFLPPGYQPPYPPFNQAVIPPMYGQGPLPTSQLAWLPQDRQETRRKSSRKQKAQSEQFAGGFAAEASFPQPNVARAASRAENAPVIPPDPSRSRAHSRSRSHAQPPPLTTPQGTGVPLTNFPPPERHPTPFIPAFGRGDSDEDSSSNTDDDNAASPARSQRPRSRSQSMDYHPVTGRIDDVLRPLPPALPTAFGPTGPRRNTPLHNPLPPPPRDLYEMTPYKSLLSLPQTTALLTASYGPQTVTTMTVPASAAMGTATATKKKKGTGLLRAFSKRSSHPANATTTADAAQQPKVQFVPVFVPENQRPGHAGQVHRQSTGSSSSTGSPTTGGGFTAAGFSSAGFPSAPPAGGFNNAGGLDSGNATAGLSTGGFPQSAPATATTFVGVPAGMDPNSPIRFTQLDPHFAGFMNHSPHRVVYRNETYPTATHVHEAMKYIDHRPDLAERIRRCENIMEVYPMSAGFSQFQRPDWGQVFIQKMEEILLLKFKQHPNLRTLLLSTYPRPLIYADALDSFWGGGPEGNGRNELGNVLQRVRGKLRDETALR